jgi:hypothetical protein
MIEMDELLVYRRTRIPEFRQIIRALPKHRSLKAAATTFEEAIEDYIDHAKPNNSPVKIEEANANAGLNNSFVVLNPAYNEEHNAWGGRRRKTRVKRKTRRSRRYRR